MIHSFTMFRRNLLLLFGSLFLVGGTSSVVYGLRGSAPNIPFQPTPASSPDSTPPSSGGAPPRTHTIGKIDRKLVRKSEELDARIAEAQKAVHKTLEDWQTASAEVKALKLLVKERDDLLRQIADQHELSFRCAAPLIGENQALRQQCVVGKRIWAVEDDGSIQLLQ